MRCKIIQTGKDKINLIYSQLHPIESLLDNSSVKNKKYKQEAIESNNIQTYLKMMYKKEMNLNIFYTKTEILDKIRKQDWKKTFPELIDILE